MADDEYVAGEELDADAQAFADREAAALGNPPREPKPDLKAKDEPDYDPSEEAGGDDGQDAGEPDPEEARARLMGWCPKEEWRGDQSRWVDAKTFNDRANPAMLHERLEKVSRERERDREEYEKRLARIDKISTDSLNRQQAEFDARIKALEREKIVNVARAEDEDKALELADQWDEYIAGQKALRPEAPPAVEKVEQPAAQAGPADPEEQKAFAAGRAWAQKRPFALGGTEKFDPAAFSYAHAELTKISLKPEFTGNYEAQFAELDKVLAKRFPEYYPQPKAPDAGAPPPGARQGATDGVKIAGKKQTHYAARLNATERAMGEKFVQKKLYPNLEAYAKEVYAND